MTEGQISKPCPVIDSQVHAYERDHAGRPWAGTLHGPAEVSGDDMVAAMDSVGVDGALLVSPWSMYRFDGSYALEVHAKHPHRFGLIKPFDPRVESVAEEIAEWAGTPGVVGARIMIMDQLQPQATDPGLNRILAAGARHDLPILAWGKLPLLADLAARHPDTQIVVDHLGLRQPFEPPVPKDSFADLESVIDLARFDNVAIKISGACTLSERGYPFDDIWEPLGRIFDAFGFDRCMWGTDSTRATAFVTYQQGVESFRLTDGLSQGERSALMGGTVEQIYRWSPFSAAQ